MALTEQQQKDRKIGSSDIAVILGLSPYKTIVELYREKIGEVPPFEGNDLTAAGTIMEQSIADLYEHRTGAKLRRSNITHAHPEHSFLTAHPDRFITGQRRGVEIKNIGRNAAREWGESGTQDVPPYYLAQCHHCMLVCDYPAWDLVAYFGGGDLCIYPIERSKEWDERIIEAGRAFWTCVETKTPPDLDPNHPAALKFLRSNKIVNLDTLQGDAMMLAWAQVRADAKHEIARYEAIVEGAEAHIYKAMGDASAMTLPDGSTLTRKTVQRKAYTVEATEYVQLNYKGPKK